MSAVTRARELDVAGEIILAASAYEEAILEKTATLDTFLDLAILYWLSTDAGIVAARRLPSSFVARAARRTDQVLDSAADRFGDVAAISGWRSLIRFLDLGEDLSDSHCRGGIGRCEACVLRDAIAGRELGPDDAERVLAATTTGTARAAYVASILRPRTRRPGRT